MGARTRLDTALTRLGLGEPELSDGSHEPSEPITEGVGTPDPASPPAVIESDPTEAGYPGRVAQPLDLDAIEERAAAPATHLDVETSLGIDLPALTGAIRSALALHPKTRVPTSGSTDPNHVPSTRTLCGLCRDGWPCGTVLALGGGS